MKRSLALALLASAALAGAAYGQDRVVPGKATTIGAAGAVISTDPSTGAAIGSLGNSQSFNRTNDTNAYTAGDVIGSATGSTAALSFAIGPVAGGEVLITSSTLEIDLSSLPSGMTTFELALYSVTPPSAYGDNTAWDLPSGDRASYLGKITLGTPVDLGSTLHVSTDSINRQITVPAGGIVYGYLITDGGYTPAAQTFYKITLHTTGL